MAAGSCVCCKVLVYADEGGRDHGYYWCHTCVMRDHPGRYVEDPKYAALIDAEADQQPTSRVQN